MKYSMLMITLLGQANEGVTCVGVLKMKHATRVQNLVKAAALLFVLISLSFFCKYTSPLCYR